MNLIQLCEFVDIEIICCSGFPLLLDPLWKMPYHFFQILSWFVKRAMWGILCQVKSADCSNLAISAGKNVIN